MPLNGFPTSFFVKYPQPNLDLIESRLRLTVEDSSACCKRAMISCGVNGSQIPSLEMNFLLSSDCRRCSDGQIDIWVLDARYVSAKFIYLLLLLQTKIMQDCKQEDAFHRIKKHTMFDGDFKGRAVPQQGNLLHATE
jgi:hypothetical protein